MKINYQNEEYELRLSMRALMLYENIAQESYSQGTLTSSVNLFYAVLLAAQYIKGNHSYNNKQINYDEFIDWVDENRDVYYEFSNWIKQQNEEQSIKSPKLKKNIKSDKELSNEEIPN